MGAERGNANQPHEKLSLFPADFNEQIFVGPEEGNTAYFGLDVLRGLVQGIEDFVDLRQDRWRRYRSLGPCLIGSAMWIDDAELIAKLETLTGACVIVTKQERKTYKLQKLADLAQVNERTPGLPVRAFSAFTWLAPRVDGKPMLVGPYGPLYDEPVPTIRTLGFRNKGKGSGRPPPLLHAKLALLGSLWWHDESGWGPDDVMGFQGKRLWVSSANFTNSSRRSIEFGYWTENPLLVEAAQRFLVKLMRSSEGLNPDADSFEPDLIEVDYDDEAMMEAMADSRADDNDDEPT
jgi:hypothetical protein